jgi:hypothetical protein
MSTEKQLTAMQELYNRNQRIIDKLEFTSNPMQAEYRKALISVNDDIDTELLATERQQLIDAVNNMSNVLIANDVMVSQINNINATPGENYYNETFKTK